MAKFNQLPAAIQQMIQTATAQNVDPSQLPYMRLNSQKAQGYNDVWAVPHLVYDFNESNYGVDLVNLREVATLDVGAACASMYVKMDPALPAWILVSASGEDRLELIECV